MTFPKYLPHSGKLLFVTWYVSAKLKNRLLNCHHSIFSLIGTVIVTNILNSFFQKQPSRGAFKKKGSENMQQIYRRTPMPKCNFNKVVQQFY